MGKNVIYNIDTSALIDLDKYYSYEVFPSLWDNFIINLVNEGRLIATEEVKEDLKRVDDDLYNWIMQRCSQIFIPTNLEIMNRVNEIINRFPNLIDKDKPGKNQADPFVIALALEVPNICSIFNQGAEIMVVTHEKFTGNLSGPKMPDICRFYGLKVGKLINIFKTEEWRIGG